MCQYCDEKALPCLMCGRACMEYQMDRSRCRGCATAHCPPDVWPVFRFCPYCGRELEGNQNENQNQGEKEMATEKYRWTAEADDTVREMLEDGRTVADICDRLGITDKQLSNRVSVLRRQDATFPRLNRGERAAVEDFENCGDTEGEAKPEPKGELNPLEKEMARMIEEREQLLAKKEEELQEAKGQARYFQDELDKKIFEGERLRQQLAKKDRVIIKMVSEIYGEV